MTGPTVEEIGVATAAAFGVAYAELIGPARPGPLAQARQSAMWLAARLTRLNYREIGRALGGRDRTTVRHGCRTIEAAMLADADLAARLDDLRQSFGEDG